MVRRSRLSDMKAGRRLSCLPSVGFCGAFEKSTRSVELEGNPVRLSCSIPGKELRKGMKLYATKPTDISVFPPSRLRSPFHQEIQCATTGEARKFLSSLLEHANAKGVPWKYVYVLVTLAHWPGTWHLWNWTILVSVTAHYKGSCIVLSAYRKGSEFVGCLTEWIIMEVPWLEVS